METFQSIADTSVQIQNCKEETFNNNDNSYEVFTDTKDIDQDEDFVEDGEGEDNDLSFEGGLEVDYLRESLKTLEGHAEIGTDNALMLNQKMQGMLEKLRDKVISMLNKCRQQYLDNQQKLLNPVSKMTLIGGIGSCGAPFFKDARGKPCPPNADYLYRSEVEKELFPGDLDHYPHFVWTATDKLGILQGVKEQAIEYIERKQAYPSGKNCLSSSKLNKNVKLHSLKLTELLAEVDENFAIDWNQISVYNLKLRHTATSCYAIWNVYLKPDINRGEWTEEENMKLNALARKNKFQDWMAIAAQIEGRSDYQCFIQYQTVVSIQMREDKRERWTKEEDELLLSLVEKHRMGNVIRWNPICSQFPNRSKSQCFARYMYSINPSISRAPFTPEEDCIILAAVAEYGENFNVFPRSLFPNRTVIQIRNRYYNSIKVREKTRFWTPADDKTLLQLVAKYGSHDWRKIADEIKTHSRTSCRTRFFVISKFLKDNPNASLVDLPRKKRGPVSTVTPLNWMNKIVEIQENGYEVRRTKDPKKVFYRFRLRNNELKWYNMLKYAYDFSYFKSFSKVPDSMVGLDFVKSVLNVDLQPPIVLQKPYSSWAVRLNLEKLIRTQAETDKSEVVNLSGYSLPPSYCTLLGFRGLCILTSSCDEQISSPSNDTEAGCRAKAKFRQRILSLLYKTTLLSRLDPDDVVEKTNFEVVFQMNTSLGRKADRSLDINVHGKSDNWTTAEDKMLLQLVTKYGSHKWEKIAKEIRTHSSDNCRARFFIISERPMDKSIANLREVPQQNLMKIQENESHLRRVIDPKKEFYRFRLRNNELIWYNILKYAYDFSYFKSFSRVTNSIVALNFVKSALSVYLQPPVALQKPYCSGAVRLNIEKLVRAQFEDDSSEVAKQQEYKLPPSYCTLLGFRGLCILTSSCIEQTSSPSNDLEAGRRAKEKFRQRLLTLLYNTALLSRLDPDDVVEKTNFEVVFDPNTSFGRAASISLAELRVSQTNSIAENIVKASRKAKRTLNTSEHSPVKKIKEVDME